MAKRKHTESRSEIDGKVEKSAKDLAEQVDVLHIGQEEVEVVRETLAELDFGGTMEGGDELAQNMEKTEDTAVEVFDAADRRLDETAADNETMEQELEEKKDADGSDQKKLETSATKIREGSTLGEIEKATQTVIRDATILADRIARAKEARDRAKQTQAGLKGRVHRGGG